jgi:hypothetical protein
MVAWTGCHRESGRVFDAGPDQNLPAFFASHSDQEQFFLDLPQKRFIESKGMFEGAVGDAPIALKPPHDAWDQSLKPSL